MTAEYELTGRLRVDMPPDEAFRLFTPRGEEDWVPGWRPVFAVPVDDDTEPGTVFQTDGHGTPTVWTVLDREAGRHIRYSRVTPQSRAGTVSVTLTAVDGGSEVEVTYWLTALTQAARAELLEFADGYPDFLQSWSDAIAKFA